MIKKIILSIIIFFLIMPGVYFYARGFLQATSTFKYEKNPAERKIDLDLIREDIMTNISRNISEIIPLKLSPDTTPVVNRFLFAKDSYKEFYVEYGYQDIKRRILVHIIRNNKDLFRYILFNYYVFEKGKGWELSQDMGERLAIDLKKFGFYEKEPLKILAYRISRSRQGGQSRLYSILRQDLILYLTVAYLEPAGKDLDIYEYGCEEDGSLKWVKKEVI